MTTINDPTILVKYKVQNDTSVYELKVPFLQLMQSFSPALDGSPMATSALNTRYFFSLFRLLSNLPGCLGTLSIYDTITDITIVDSSTINSQDFAAFISTHNSPTLQNFICLDTLHEYSAGQTGTSNFSYFGTSSTNPYKLPLAIKNFTCNYPCFFSIYSSYCFSGSSTLQNTFLNLQQEQVPPNYTASYPMRSALQKITVPPYTFSKTTSLVSFTSSYANSIGEKAFSECTSLSVVYIPSVVVISNKAFSQCSSISRLSIPSIQYIMNDPTGTGWNSADSTMGSSQISFIKLPVNYKFIFTMDHPVNHDYIYSEINYLINRMSVGSIISTIRQSEINNYISCTIDAMNTNCIITDLNTDVSLDNIVFNNTIFDNCYTTFNISCFRNITFDVTDNNVENTSNFKFNNITTVVSVPAPFTSIPLLDTTNFVNTSISDEFIKLTLDKLSTSIQSVNTTSIETYKTNVFNNLNSSLWNLLSTKQQSIGKTLYNFAMNTDRIVYTTTMVGGVEKTTGGVINMYSGDFIQFLTTLHAGNNLTFCKTYQTICNLG